LTLKHPAQLNIGRLQAPLDDPGMAEFAGNLARINALAEASPGFVWRMQDEAIGNATSIPTPFGPDVLANMSLWEDLASLRAYVYRSEHTGFLKRRRLWFEEFDGAYMVLWWVPAGHRPSLIEAKAALDRLACHGSTAAAFTFRRPFTADGRPVQRGAGMAA
jgi:hypothetical protein